MKKYKAVLLILISAACFCGCSMRIINADNAQCGRRVQSDRERCLRNVQANEEALATRKNPERDSRETWADHTIDGIDAAAGKRAP